MSPKRLALAAIAVLGLGGSGAAAMPAPSLGGALTAATPPRATLSGFVCQRAVNPPERAVSVTAVMRPLSGTERMQLRFDLLDAKRAGGPYAEVHAANLGTWLSPSNPTLGQQPGDVWNVRHPVVDLPGPAYYRFRVTFRWEGQGDRVIGETTLDSSTCYQPDVRPDLVVTSIKVKPRTADKYNYVAVVRNRGATGAGPFAVELSSGDGLQTPLTIKWLGAHAKTSVKFAAPACVAGQPVTVTADPGHQIDESDPGRTSLTVSCPAFAT